MTADIVATLKIDIWYKAAIYLGLIMTIASATGLSTKYTGFGVGSLILGLVVLSLDTIIKQWRQRTIAKLSNQGGSRRYINDEIIGETMPYLILHQAVIILGLIIWIAFILASFQL